MVGKVITSRLDNMDLDSGSIVVLERAGSLEICTMQHRDMDGNWVVIGQVSDNHTICDNDRLCKLSIESAGTIYPLKFNQWNNAIKYGEVNMDKPVTFELVPVRKFITGKSVKRCISCDRVYMGAENQRDCKPCCEKEVTAKIILTKIVKPKRPRLVKEAYKEAVNPTTIATQAYEMGKAGKTAKQFITWLDKQF